MKRILQIFFILVIGFVFITNCTKKAPEKIIEKVGGITFKGIHKKSDTDYFLRFFKEMQQSVESKDLDKSFSFYSKDFKNDEGVKLDLLKRNTGILYKNYKNIVYKMTNISVFIKGDKAISIDEFLYSAEPIKRGYKKLDYTGRERIYWQKEGKDWKIVNWIFEK